MRCIVTAGPTWEPLDRVRRLTNFSTGRLGGELANTLAAAGHDVVLWLSETATWDRPLHTVRTERFSTTDSLARGLRSESGSERLALFHAAAVSDFQAGNVFERQTDGSLKSVQAGKLTTAGASLMVELIPTPKILPQLRGWFPSALIVGWKFEVDGTRTDAIARGTTQLRTASSDFCVVNGPAYGPGFGLLDPAGRLQECGSAVELYHRLQDLL